MSSKIFPVLAFMLLFTTQGIAQLFSEHQKIVALDRGGVNDFFGINVSIDGNYAIVGAIYEDDDELGNNPLNGAGAAYIFEKDGGGNWTQAQKLVASDRAPGDWYGRSVAISGNYAVVGAYQEDHNAMGTGTLSEAGSAYIYERDGGGNWNFAQKIVASDRAADDEFGFS